MGAPVAASDAGTAVVVGPAEAVGLSDVVVTSLVGVRVAEAGRRCEPPEQPVAPAARARAAATADGYRRSTIAWANSEHLTSVAPSMSRAKS